jgi:hypothetical protein
MWVSRSIIVKLWIIERDLKISNRRDSNLPDRIWWYPSIDRLAQATV